MGDVPERHAVTGMTDPPKTTSRRLRVLLFAYACEPDRGSEPGVGWNVATRLAKYHDVWVLTRANNREQIERTLAKGPVPGLSFIYHDLPSWASWWKKGGRGVQLYSYLWQLTAVRVAKRWHVRIGFEAVHHVTFVKYWAPSGAAFLGLPFLWGPVGGGDGVPPGFWRGLSTRSKLTEMLRILVQRLAELDPLLRVTARRSTLAFGATEATCERLRMLGARRVAQRQAVALDESEVSSARRQIVEGPGPTRYISIGRLEGLKGHHLSLAALAQAELSDVHLTVVGGGEEGERLARLAGKLGIGHQVEFTGALPRHETLELLANSHVLVQAGLHESGSSVTLEAMAAGVPVLALKLGGPAYHVTAHTGVLIEADTERRAVASLAVGMRLLAKDSELRQRLGAAGLERLREHLSWDVLVQKLAMELSSMVER